MKNWKHSIVGILIIFTIVFATCSKKSLRTEGSTQSQTAAALTANPHPEILNGDLTAFAGTWVDGFGTRSQLRADGVFSSGSMGNLMADGFSMYDYGAYVWNVRDTGGYGGFGVMVYPPGVPINLFYMDGGVRKIAETIETDTTKVRITAGQDGPSSNAEVYYREGEAPRAAASSDTHPEILNGDLSAFAGTWVNGHGKSIKLTSSGLFHNGYHAYNFKNIGGSYSWDVSMDGDSAPIRLFPTGIELINGNNQIIQTDTTKPRINIDFVDSNTDVYYREGEASAENDLNAGDLIGQWRFESGSNINFLGHEFVTIGTDDFMEIWGIRPGESYMSGGSYTKETAFWKITGSGKLEIYHESGVNGVFNFTILIKDDVMNITDQNGNSAVFKKVYLQ